MTEQFADEDASIDDEFRWNILLKKAQILRVGKAFALFRKHGIEPILIKGWAAARFYPSTKFRNSIDIDLAVAAGDFESASLICRSAEADGLPIYLHRELRHLDTANWNDLFANSEIINVETGTVRVLRPEDHLRVLIVHWLTDGGGNKERLSDICYLVDNRPPDFDWNRFLNLVDRRRRRWMTCTVGLASRYLGLDLAGTPIKDEAAGLPSWLIKTVEKEWASDTKLEPLHSSLKDPKLFVKQLGKRLRPNPIWATVHMEGSFDAKTRIFYQVGSWFKRILPSLRHAAKTIYMMRSK